jgi:hypothetical protein
VGWLNQCKNNPLTLKKNNYRVESRVKNTYSLVLAFHNSQNSIYIKACSVKSSSYTKKLIWNLTSIFFIFDVKLSNQ